MVGDFLFMRNKNLQVAKRSVIARYEAIPNYTGRTCKSGIASYLAMTPFRLCYFNIIT
jgi:hypothetical protein